MCDLGVLSSCLYESEALDTSCTKQGASAFNSAIHSPKDVHGVHRGQTLPSSTHISRAGHRWFYAKYSNLLHYLLSFNQGDIHALV